ncbi:hypothetical protein PAHAL_5G271700 [Panicum hallii]|uniref:Reverse transcriptase zinc-binding domain-containing protein n=1 Tax=Panicum hallii TaxID=206008 RepID=A0A2T8ILE2_9POAL|nr:hypothetical protein PAHAL_5G271700 [Panicum hallii]
MSTLGEMAEFVQLWDLVSNFSLDADQPDTVTWKWTRMSAFNGPSIWTTEAVGKHKFFARVWTTDMVPMLDPASTVEAWWRSSQRGLPNKLRRLKAAVLMYTTWNIWKKRNRRIFEHRSCQPTQAFELIKEEMELRKKPAGAGDFF